MHGGGICTNNQAAFKKCGTGSAEGFLTYGGMSIREIEAITWVLEETMDEEMINQGPEFIALW